VNCRAPPSVAILLYLTMSDYFLADDLSGALDAAAAFHHAGRRVTIALTADHWPAAMKDEVIGITTETRNASAADAAPVIARVIEQGNARSARLCYKKIDSTLRGPVAAETAALLAALPDVRVLFCPANPRVGRTVRGGVLLVHDVPVAETEFARDPVCPVRESSIPALLGPAMSSRVVVADAVSGTDLTTAVARMNAAGTPWVAIGSGALARPVAALASIGTPSGDDSVDRQSFGGPILFVCGSANPANRQQAAAFTRECGVPVREITAGGAKASVVSAITDAKQNGVAALMIDPERIDSAMALRAITDAARAVIDEARVARIFATGGETAYALCRELGIDTLKFQAELEPGLSLSVAECAIGVMMWAVKPGGFGDEETWLRAWHALRGHCGDTSAPGVVKAEPD
jgi:D-threonate/D-erythronate kinase